MPERRPVLEIDPNSREFGEKLHEYRKILTSIELDFNQALEFRSESTIMLTDEFFESEKTIERLTRLNNDVGALHGLMEDFAYEIGEAYFIKAMHLKFNKLPEDLESMLDGFTLENLDRDGWKQFTAYIYGESMGLQIARLVETDIENKTIYQKYTDAIGVVGGNAVLNKFQAESSL